jgi:predicted protein tyrosine phosphatase
MYKLFLDDIRSVSTVYPKLSDSDFVIVRNFEDFKSTILEKGLPDFISFDNDLGLDVDGNIAKEGYDCAKWLIYQSGLDLTDLKFNIHSQNPIGKENIRSLLNNYIKFIKEENKTNESKIKILFVCTVNRLRSATAHKIYESDNRFEVKSAGTDKSANTVISLDILNWADIILVMDKQHNNFIRNKFPDIHKNKKIVCLHIPDIYDYMQPELISILKEKVEDIYKQGLKLN